MFILKWLGGVRTSKNKSKVKAKVVDVIDEIAFRKKVGDLHLICTIALTLMVAIVFQQIIGVTFVALQDVTVALIVTGVYTGMVFTFRILQKSGTCYLFQLTVAGTAGACQYASTTYDYRLMALGTFIVLMFQNRCIDKHLLKMGKIDNSLCNFRAVVCGLMVLLSIGGYGFSFRFYPDSRGSPSQICDATQDESYHFQNDEQNRFTDDVDDDEFTMPEVARLLDKGSDILTNLYQNAKELGEITELSGQEVCGYPREWVDQLKSFENDPLFKGAETQSKAHQDKLRPEITEVGYGVTAGEIHDAKQYGYLPKGAVLPKSLTKEEADTWMEKVTLPTYEAMVCATVKVPLTLPQRFALLSFAHNLGGGSLDKLACFKNRINSGNLHCAPGIMRLYVNAGRHTNVSGLVKRRNWEANLFAESLGDVASN